jgi:hydroquinone glucosyltransferase
MALNDTALNLFLQTKVILEIGALLPEAQFCDDKTGDHMIKETTHEKHPCILWLNLQVPSSVLFISFGSVATLSAPQILDLAAGIEASNQPFLWILRSPDAPMMTHDYDGALPALEFLPPGISTGSLYYPYWNQRPYNP